MKANPVKNPRRCAVFARSFTIAVLIVVLNVNPLHAAETKETPKTETLFAKYCFDCHSGRDSEGRLALDQLLGGKPSPENETNWRKTWKIMRHEFMPPVGSDQPTNEERRAMTGWILREKLGVDASKPDPGRVTVRRLNRAEYEYSVQDLFGVEYAKEADFSTDVAQSGNALLRLRDRLPPDETAFGFDNVGDFLSLTPALLERYFDIAELVVNDTVMFDGPRSPVRSLAPQAFVVVKEENEHRTRHTAEWHAPHTGRYRIEGSFTVGGWQAYGGAYQFNATAAGQELARKRIEVGGYKAHNFSAEFEFKAGKNSILLDTLAERENEKGEWNYLQLRPTLKIIGPLGSEFAEYSEAHQRIFTRGSAPADPKARRQYAREILQKFATAAFRRPANSETLDRLVALSEKSAQFEKGIANALVAILTSPKFLYRAEAQPLPDDPRAIHELDEYALASRLSYLFWLSLPDQELLQLASKNQLRTNLSAQVRRMLSDPKSARFFEDFPGQWLRTRNVLMTPISKSGSKFDPVRVAMKKETELLFEHIAREDRDLFELVSADYSFLNKKLASFYGIEGVEAEEMQRVKLPPDSQRGGILAHGSFLVSTSNPNRTSPVKRGLFILENLLGLEPPPPPPNIPALDDVNLGDTTKKTGRQLLALHREHASCAACHAHFDPLGIALEKYDLIGLRREQENELEIDTQETTIKGERIGSLKDVQTYLAGHKQHFYRAVTEKLLIYALGRGLEPGDSPQVDEIAQKLEKSGGKFSTLLLGVIESPAFQMRRGDDGGGKSSLRSYVPAIPSPEKRRPPKKQDAADKPKSPPAEK